MVFAEEPILVEPNWEDAGMRPVEFAQLPRPWWVWADQEDLSDDDDDDFFNQHQWLDDDEPEVRMFAPNVWYEPVVVEELATPLQPIDPLRMLDVPARNREILKRAREEEGL